MNILILGAGLSGCTAARLLADKGHNIYLVDKENRPGGLAITRENNNEPIYDLYGGHIFHTRNEKIYNFLKKFSKFMDYEHRKGIIINGKCLQYPLNYKDIDPLNIKNANIGGLSTIERIIIQRELSNLSKYKKEKPKNFKEAAINIFGPTLYEIIIENYSKNQWGMDPENMIADWAPKRLEIRYDDDDRLFRDEFQGIPVEGYTELLWNMIDHKNIKFLPNIFISYNEMFNNLKKENKIDLTFSSIPIEIFYLGGYPLPYRGSKFIFDKDINSEINWENDNYGTINFSSGSVLRKINYGVIYYGHPKASRICLQIGSGDEDGKMYPVHTKNSINYFRGLLYLALKLKIIPIGRLGAFKYLNMDEAIEATMNIIEKFDLWINEESLFKKVEEWSNIFKWAFPKEV